MDRCIVRIIDPMAPAHTVQRSLRGASFTKAPQCVGMQQPLQQCRRATIWVSKLTVAGCLA
ncbi:MAG: hypothetical protein C0502_00975 [Opitutus sp.]|nr:hypothetical protein [Opitutus sp.]